MSADETARLTADVVLLATGEDGQRCVLLIRRGWDPFAGRWALPGGHVDAGEDTADAARRELREETGLHAGDLDLVGAYAAPGRDPRGRYVTFAYTATLTGPLPAPTAGDDATAARWWPVAELTAAEMAFDHHQILTDALRHHARRADSTLRDLANNLPAADDVPDPAESAHGMVWALSAEFRTGWDACRDATRAWLLSGGDRR